MSIDNIKLMAEVKILLKGYANEGTEENSCSTISLVKDKDIIMVVDPGTAKNQDIIIEKLKAEGLKKDDVNIVCITHSHMDHYRNIGMFPKAKALDYFGLWDGDTVDDWNEQFTDNIKIIKTPGHSYDSITLLVKTDKGTVAVCGDVFWKEGYPKNDPYASDKEKLEKSRKRVLKMADWIIPGHDDIFRVKR